MHQLINNWTTPLIGDISLTSLILTVDAAKAAELSAATVTRPISITLTNNFSDEVEIVHVTGVSNNQLTVVRGQDGSTSQAWFSTATLSTNITREIMNAAMSGLELVSEVVADNLSAVFFLDMLTDDYDQYMVMFDDLQFSDSGAGFYLQVSGENSFVVNQNYNSYLDTKVIGAGASSTLTGATDISAISLGSALGQQSLNIGCSGQILISAATIATETQIDSHIVATSQVNVHYAYHAHAACRVQELTPSLRLAPGAGTFSGTLRLYGIRA